MVGDDASSAIIGLRFNNIRRSNAPVGWLIAAVLGFQRGLVCAILSSIFIFGIAAFKENKQTVFDVMREISIRVIVGQFCGTCGAISTFLVVEFCLAHIQNAPFDQSVNEHAPIFLWASPILMICGAIAGALSKRDLPKAATLNAE